MEALIQASIEDGVLTDLEKNVLVKRAQKENIDLDELEVYIDSLLQKQRKANQKTQQSDENQREKWHGKVAKCPNCGAPVEPGIAKCTACGYAFSGLTANKSAQEFSKQLQIVEAKHKGTSQEEKTVKAEALSTVIATFPIPTTKEDLLEFLLILKTGFSNLPNINPDYIVKQAYRSKIKECIEKINMSFPNDSLFQKQIQEVEKAFEESDASLKKVYGCLTAFGIAIALFIILGILGVFD